jgi:hypothetical protein
MSLTTPTWAGSWPFSFLPFFPSFLTTPTHIRFSFLNLPRLFAHHFTQRTPQLNLDGRYPYKIKDQEIDVPITAPL